MRVILLNGPSSVGKTSLSKMLQKILPQPYLATSLDHYIEMIPAHMNDYAGTLAPHPGFGWVRKHDSDGQPLSHLTPGKYGQKVYDVFKRQVQHLADQGFNIIVDHVALDPNDYKQWKTHLIHHQILFVKLTAAPEILNLRESGRLDRVAGVSRALQQTVHTNYEYDIELDTGKYLPEECAELISAMIFSQS